MAIEGTFMDRSLDKGAQAATFCWRKKRTP